MAAINPQNRKLQRERWLRLGRTLPSKKLVEREQRNAISREGLSLLVKSGLLHGFEAASEYHSIFDALGATCFDSGLLFMSHAHLWGGWAPLKKFAPQIAEQVAKKEEILALAMTEAQSGSDCFRLSTKAKSVREGWLLSGQKCFVTNAPIAGAFLIFARQTGSLHPLDFSCFLVRKNTSGLRVGKNLQKVGLRTAACADLSLDNVLVSPKNLVGRIGDGAQVFQYAMAWERSLIFSDAASTLNRLTDLVVAAAKKKKRSAKALTEMPLFQEKLQEINSIASEIRSITHKAALALDKGQLSPILSMETKSQAAQLFHIASTLLFQVSGSAAFLAGNEIEINLRNSLGGFFYSGPNDLLDLLVKEIHDS